MNRSAAVARINQGIGFRAAGNALEANIILMLQEAQRDLERGKTLPKFLLQESQSLSLASGAHTVALPTGFLRDSDENPIHFFPSDSTRPRYLTRYGYRTASEATDLIQENDPEQAAQTGAPARYAIRKATIDFITNADQAYTLYWDYYKADDLLTTNIENGWLENAAEWLIGEAGWRLAMDLGNVDATVKFDQMRKAGNRACIGDLIAAEISSGPLRMGANL
jgi:hypothetical protein